jgi:prevent-host-death family protein
MYTEFMADTDSHTATVRDARAHFAALINNAESGLPTVITRNGQPIAALVPIDDFNTLEDAVDEYMAREARRALVEEADAPRVSMAEMVAEIFDEQRDRDSAA